MQFPEIRITGDTSVTVLFGDEISKGINARIRAFDKRLSSAKTEGIIETVPSYCALMIHYDPEKILFHDLKNRLEVLLSKPFHDNVMKTEVIEIPVLYGGEFGQDLDYVAEYHGMTPQEVVEIHTRPEYLIYMLGFTPGFSYMGGMDESIATPRLSTPRVLIPAGSVGIAGSQTGIYPLDSPGGWQLIGRTPVRMYDPGRESPILLDAGMKVRFFPIDRREYDQIAGLAARGSYKCHRYVSEEA